MPFDWIRFLQLAHAIVRGEGSTDEAALRTATSRAYYAAYHVALRYCTEHGYSFRGVGQDHQLVRDYLTALGKGQASIYLYELHELRKQADYHDHPRLVPLWLWLSSSTRAQSLLEELRRP